MDYHLEKGEVISLKAASLHCLRVAAGCIWLTRPDDPRDYLLGHGDRFALGSGGTFVLEALADATFEVECPAASQVQMTIRISPCSAQQAL
jgi:hypothetical protein